MLRQLKPSIALLGIAAAGILALPLWSAHGQEPARQIVDANGNMRVPDDYRTAYEFLGTWAIAAASGSGSAEIHNVYASPGTIKAHREAGTFPDGAILVKEVLEAKTSSMTTGTVSHADTLKGWFVMVKDAKNSHPGNPLWANGWGWSWFDASAPTRTTSTNFKSDCQACHIPAKATEWIYKAGYPPLTK